MSRGLVLLDRDGVLNRLRVDAEQGTIDSPMNAVEVELYPWVPAALKKISDLGYGLAIVTNQPAAAKGKTTLKNLETAHEAVLAVAQAAGAKILSSHICFHRSEDGCACRKPKTGLLEDAFKRNPKYDRAGSWVVGDGLTDVQAGRALGVKTAFISPKKPEYRKVFDERGVAQPDLWCEDLREFAEYLAQQR